MIEKDSSLIEAKSVNGMSAIITVLYYGKNEIVDTLVSNGANLNIFEAAAVAKLSLVQKFVEKDESLVNSYSNNGFTPLHLASFFGDLKVVRFLMEKKVNVNQVAENPTKVMPLLPAVAGNSTEISRLLVAGGADVNARQQCGFTALHGTAQNGNFEIVKLLLERGAEINARNDSGTTSLSFASIDSPESSPKADGQRVVEFLKQCGAVE